MNAVLNHEQPDRVPFVPSIYEHGARVINKSPYEASRSAALTAEAALKSFEIYGHDLVTVGIDIYNVEAEAFGCELSFDPEKYIPGIKSHPLAGSTALDASGLKVPAPEKGNRLQMIVDATERVVDEAGDEVWVLATMSGPFSQAAELRGFENLICDMVDTPERVHELLNVTTELSIQQARRISEVGAGVSIFESWATIPLITSDIFAEYVVPYNRKVIEMIKRDYEVPPPAVIMGGDTAALMDHFIEVGTSLVVADYMTDLEFMKEKTRDINMIVRGCADPKMIEREQWDGVRTSIDGLARKKKGMNNFVWGCGCVSLDTSTDALMKFKKMCAEAGAH